MPWDRTWEDVDDIRGFVGRYFFNFDSDDYENLSRRAEQLGDVDFAALLWEIAEAKRPEEQILRPLRHYQTLKDWQKDADKLERAMKPLWKKHRPLFTCRQFRMSERDAEECVVRWPCGVCGDDIWHGIRTWDEVRVALR